MESIVKKYFASGRLLSPEALAVLAEKPGTMRSTDSLVLTPDDFVFPSEEDFEIIKNFTEIPKEMTTHDFVGFYNSKYEKMSGIIQERTKKTFVSINKLGNLAESYIIGMVKDVKEKDGKQIVEIEDPTGARPVVFSERVEVELDDVVALRGVSRGNVIFGKQVIYPDVPLRQPAIGRGKACFISDPHLEEAPEKDLIKFIKWLRMQDVSAVFVTGVIGDEKRFEEVARDFDKRIIVAYASKSYPSLPFNFSSGSITSLSNPSMVCFNGLKVLMIDKFTQGMLLRRHLGKSSIMMKDDYMVLEEIPDIVHCSHTRKPFVENYKSITIVNGGSLLTEFRPAIIDFATREIRQINPDEL